MALNLRTKNGYRNYSQCMAFEEPVNWQNRQCWGLRRFLLRGLEKVDGEWHVIASTHNLHILLGFQKSHELTWPAASG
jgi:hypothetical protein